MFSYKMNCHNKDRTNIIELIKTLLISLDINISIGDRLEIIILILVIRDMITKLEYGENSAEIVSVMSTPSFAMMMNEDELELET